MMAAKLAYSTLEPPHRTEGAQSKQFGHVLETSIARHLVASGLRSRIRPVSTRSETEKVSRPTGSAYHQARPRLTLVVA